MEIENLVRPNIKNLVAYTTARHEYIGEADIYLDANENSYGSPITLPQGITAQLNRYPNPLQTRLKQKLSEIKGIAPQHIFIGNGSDECIDVLMRVFAEPAIDNIITISPTYGMYKVCAAINNITLHEITLTNTYQLNVKKIIETINSNTKLIFLCNPNNPTGTTFAQQDILTILQAFAGVVVIDEAYINFSTHPSYIAQLTRYPNLVIMQTLSKAWGLAGLRIGMLYGASSIIHYCNTVKYPYNVSTINEQLALQALNNLPTVNVWIKQTNHEKELLATTLLNKMLCKNIFKSDTNFLLIEFEKANELYQYLCSKGIIVRNRSTVPTIPNCLRITIGTASQNERLIAEITNFYTKN